MIDAHLNIITGLLLLLVACAANDDYERINGVIVLGGVLTMIFGITQLIMGLLK